MAEGDPLMADQRMLQRHQTLRGIFRPKRCDNLRAGALAHIGREIEFSVAWRIEEGPYQGQWALLAAEGLDPILGWVPEEDVEIL